MKKIPDPYCSPHTLFTTYVKLSLQGRRKWCQHEALPIVKTTTTKCSKFQIVKIKKNHSLFNIWHWIETPFGAHHFPHAPTGDRLAFIARSNVTFSLLKQSSFSNRIDSHELMAYSVGQIRKKHWWKWKDMNDLKRLISIVMYYISLWYGSHL